jgi:hypothetical protein
MSIWDETWTWPRPGESLLPEEKNPFWDLTPMVRGALHRHMTKAGPPEKVLLGLFAEGSPSCDQFERALGSLGRHVRKQSLVCLKAVCGHIASETMQIVRVGNCDFRLSHFPTSFYFSVLPPDDEGADVLLDDEANEPQDTSDLVAPLSDPEDLLEELGGAAEEAGGEPTSRSESTFCRLEFVSLGLGLPVSPPSNWWAYLGEGHSVWDFEVQDLTVKVSVFGEVVRTLAFPNHFHQDFTLLL